MFERNLYANGSSDCLFSLFLYSLAQDLHEIEAKNAQFGTYTPFEIDCTFDSLIFCHSVKNFVTAVFFFVSFSLYAIFTVALFTKNLLFNWTIKRLTEFVILMIFEFFSAKFSIFTSTLVEIGWCTDFFDSSSVIVNKQTICI